MIYSYDLSRQPCSYDFVAWLLNVDIVRDGPVGLSIKGDPPRIGPRGEDAERLFLGVVLPAMTMLADSWRTAEEGQALPFQLRHAVENYRGRAPRLAVPAYARDAVRADFPERPAVITLREAAHWPMRNSSLDDWLLAAAWLENRGIPAVFVRDTEKADAPLGFPTCPRASRELHYRAALYEHARINLCVSNGPRALFHGLAAPHLVVKLFTPGAGTYARDPEGVYQGTGLRPGESPPWSTPHQRLAWCDDSFENIIRNLEPMLEGI